PAASVAMNTWRLWRGSRLDCCCGDAGTCAVSTPMLQHLLPRGGTGPRLVAGVAFDVRIKRRFSFHGNGVFEIPLLDELLVSLKHATEHRLSFRACQTFFGKVCNKGVVIGTIDDNGIDY